MYVHGELPERGDDPFGSNEKNNEDISFFANHSSPRKCLIANPTCTFARIIHKMQIIRIDVLQLIAPMMIDLT